MEKESKQKRASSEENVYMDYSEKMQDIQSGKSKFFYFCLFLLNVCILLLAFIWLNNTKGINCFELLLQVWDNKIFIIMLSIFLFIGILNTLPSFLKLYNKQKQRKFGVLYKSNIVGNYYESVTMGGRGRKIASTMYLTNAGISKQNSLSLIHGAGVFNRISILTISIIMLIIGAFSWVRNVNILLYWVALLSVVIEILYIVFLIIFASNKKRGLGILARLCKILYNIKLVKDYESAYNKMIDHVSIKANALKQNKAIMLTEIASYMLVYVLRIVILYLGLYTISSKMVDSLWLLAFTFIVLDSIINILPLQKGTIIVEILFIFMFTNVFTEAYVFFGLLIYKIFEYFMHAIMFVLIVLIDKLINLVSVKKKNKENNSK